MSDAPAFDPNQPFEPVSATPAEKPAFDENAPHEPLSQPEASAKPAFDPNQSFEEHDENKYGSLGQQAIAGLEGAARGASFGLSSGLERMLGAKPEDVIGRQEENPWTAGLGETAGLVGSAFIPVVGEANLLSKVGQATAEAANLGKIGNAVIRGAVETGLFQGGDEISKAMLGKGNPEDPVASALAHMGAAALMGGLAGGVFESASSGLAKLADTKIGSKLAQFGEDFGNRWKFLQENPDPVTAVTDEVKNFHNTILGNGEDAFGLKKDAAEKLVPQVSEKIDSQIQEISEKMSSTLENASKSVKTKSAVPFISEDLNAWQNVVTDPNASTADKFMATDTLKKTLAGYAKWGLTEEGTARGKIGQELSRYLKDSLENTGVWGDMGKVQKELNSAYSNLVKRDGPLKTFTSGFMSADGSGGKVVDPSKVKTLISQIESGKTDKKSNILLNYIESMKKYQGVVEGIHDKLGLPNPVQPSSLNSTNDLLSNAHSPGSKLADTLSGKSGMVSKAVDLGASLMHGFGGHYAAKVISPILEDAVGRPLNQMAAQTIMKTLGSGAYNAAPEALAHAEVVRKGASKVSNAIDALFTAGSANSLKFEKSEKDREKLRKFVEKGGVTQQLQNTLNSTQPMPDPDQGEGYAEGGDVKGMGAKPLAIPQKPESGSSKLSQVYPEQDMLMQTAKGRIYGYLNNQRPQENAAKLPFDSKIEDKAHNREYDKLLDMANQPLSVLDHVKQGTLTADHMKHFTQMYPELYNHLSKKMTEKVIEAQTKNEKPPYSVRQSLSLFLGAPLESSFTPGSIQAAQGVFAQKAQQQQDQGMANKNKKGTATLTKSYESKLTPDQARSERQLKA